MTEAELKRGISLARGNARRLALDAKLLLLADGSSASVYSMWHMAVEELGKSLILSDSLQPALTTRGITVPLPLFRGMHEEKFNAGFDKLPRTAAAGLGYSVRVFTNSARDGIHIPSPRGLKSLLFRIPGFITGLIVADATPSHDLRLGLQYIDFDNGEWLEPEATVRDHSVHAKTSLVRDGLKLAIDEILEIL